MLTEDCEDGSFMPPKGMWHLMEQRMKNVRQGTMKERIAGVQECKAMGKSKRLTCRGRTAEEGVLRKGSEFKANFEQNATIRHVVIGTLPRVSITRLNQDASMATNVMSDTLRLMGSPAQCRRKVV